MAITPMATCMQRVSMRFLMAFLLFLDAAVGSHLVGFWHMAYRNEKTPNFAY
jgi:hypothetical protein